MSITVPTNIPTGDRRTRAVTGIIIPAQPVPLVDRDGDVWHPTGETTADGEQVLHCPAPAAPEDQGDGPSFPWTLRALELAFGPLRPMGGAA
ncbi:hypothetical protein ACF068_14735 [Streptomyces sp. NPDC016309]|uniref:hypothetical protein n=1 Tax=Streptomyces sp. NPDC016309 TaxID=3364965 RepID=UPI0036FF47B6